MKLLLSRIKQILEHITPDMEGNITQNFSGSLLGKWVRPQEMQSPQIYSQLYFGLTPSLPLHHLTQGTLLDRVKVLLLCRCRRNWWRSPFSMYSVIMQRGSSFTHTPNKRMMFGSFSRDMILISFRKSFLGRVEKGWMAKHLVVKSWWTSLLFQLYGERSIFRIE